MPSPGKVHSIELHASGIELSGGRIPHLSPQKKQFFEFLRQIAHLRPRTNTIGAVRGYAIDDLRSIVISGSGILLCPHSHQLHDCEGSGEVFRVTR
jgi:asparaginyl-tRNA synthetase